MLAASSRLGRSIWAFAPSLRYRTSFLFFFILFLLFYFSYFNIFLSHFLSSASASVPALGLTDLFIFLLKKETFLRLLLLLPLQFVLPLLFFSSQAQRKERRIFNQRMKNKEKLHANGCSEFWLKMHSSVLPLRHTKTAFVSLSLCCAWNWNEIWIGLSLKKKRSKLG